LSDSEAEAGETQVWIEFALAHSFITNKIYEDLYDKYEHIISMLVKMEKSSSTWAIRSR
jgi:four helix bundle protein